VERQKETESFLVKNRRNAELVWVDNDARVRVLQRRSHTELPELLEDISKGKLGRFGASREVGAAVAKTGRVMRGKALAHHASSRKWLKRAVLEIVGDTFGTSDA
jgi:hypothetical protein